VLGELRPGLPADLVLFDADVIADRATFESPWEYPVGIEGVWVGGIRVVQQGDLAPEADVVAGDPRAAESDGAGQRPSTTGERAT
jgi:N-acyl-D-aspartate/D-glutamate deacylase